MTQTYIPREYGGTGLTLEQLDALPPAERNAILVATIDTLRERLADLRSQLAEAEAMIREQMRAAARICLKQAVTRSSWSRRPGGSTTQKDSCNSLMPLNSRIGNTPFSPLR